MEKGPLVTTVATGQAPAGFQSCWSPSVSPPAPAQRGQELPEPPAVPFPHGSFPQPQAAGFSFSKPFSSQSKVCRHTNTWKTVSGVQPQGHPGSGSRASQGQVRYTEMCGFCDLGRETNPIIFSHLEQAKDSTLRTLRSYSNPMEPHIFAY